MGATANPDPTAAGSPAKVRLYSIGRLAEAAGLSGEQIRMWERRHGRPQPVRLPSGHRRYTEATLRWLRRIAEAIRRGHRPHRLLALDDAALDALLAEEQARTTPAETAWGSSARVRDDGARGADEPMAAVQRFDTHGLGRWCTRIAAQHPVLVALREHYGPFLVRVGVAWREGRIGVGEEHLASGIVEDELVRWRRRLPVRHDGPRVLLATLAGERHGVGISMAALVAADAGLPVHMLGTDSPLGAIQAAAGALRADVVGIGVSLAGEGLETERRLAALRDLLDPRVVVVAGGEGVATVRRGPRGVLRITDLAEWQRLLVERRDGVASEARAGTPHAPA